MSAAEQIRQFYERLVGKHCEVQPFVVDKDSNRGFWMAHVLGTCDFYLVHWKRRE